MMCVSLVQHGYLVSLIPKGKCDIDITCNALDGNQIDWDCVFGPESLEEVHERGGQFTTCRDKSGKSPCSRYHRMSGWNRMRHCLINSYLNGNVPDSIATVALAVCGKYACRQCGVACKKILRRRCHWCGLKDGVCAIGVVVVSSSYGS